MTFKDFEKELKEINYKVNSDWSIALPYHNKIDVQKIIDICRAIQVIDWHVFYTEETEENPKPDILMTWDIGSKS